LSKPAEIHSAAQLKKSYDHIYQHEQIRESAEHYDWVFRRLAPASDKRLLDVACGGGYFLQVAERYVRHAVGIELSESALQIAAKNVKKAILFCGDGEILPLRDESFDYVVNLGSLEHFLSPVNGLKEMVRVLRQGGRAALLLPNNYFAMVILNVWRTGSTGRNTFQELDRWGTQKEWSDLIESSGLEIEAIHKYNYKTPSMPWKYRLLRPWIPLNLSYAFLFVCRREK